MAVAATHTTHYAVGDRRRRVLPTFHFYTLRCQCCLSRYRRVYVFYMGTTLVWTGSREINFSSLESQAKYSKVSVL